MNFQTSGRPARKGRRGDVEAAQETFSRYGLNPSAFSACPLRPLRSRFFAACKLYQERKRWRCIGPPGESS